MWFVNNIFTKIGKYDTIELVVIILKGVMLMSYNFNNEKISYIAEGISGKIIRDSAKASLGGETLNDTNLRWNTHTADQKLDARTAKIGEEIKL